MESTLHLQQSKLSPLSLLHVEQFENFRFALKRINLLDSKRLLNKLNYCYLPRGAWCAVVKGQPPETFICVYLTYTIIPDNAENVNKFLYFLQLFAVKNNAVLTLKFV